MTKLLCDFTSTELSSRQRNISSSEARGEASEEEQLAPELPPLTNKPCGGQEEGEGAAASGLPRKAQLLFANKQERDIMWREELEQLSRATRER